MIKEILMYDGDMVAKYKETDEVKQKVFDAIIKWCKEYNVYSGESFQSDDPQTEAPWLIADIVENIIKFKTEWKDSDDDLPW